jgi:hypothetical protein
MFEGVEGMPVCIAGMHRSGTSMVASLLHQCGLFLGPEDELMQATVDNQNGYWENLRFKALNDEILREFGGSWDTPPTFPSGLSGDERFERLKVKAEHLLRAFTGHEPCGWKDPRNSLTLPFWTTLLPRLKVIVCLRNPYEVYLSLRQRRYSAHARGLRLWLIFNQRILDGTLLDQRLITHYDAHFRDPQAELRRMLNFLELPLPFEKSIPGGKVVRPRLRNHHYSLPHLLEFGVGQEVLDLYAKMCAEANYEEPLRDARPKALTSEGKRL